MKATASEINFFIQIFSLHFGLSHTTSVYAESSLEVSRIYFCLRHREENVDKNVNMMGRRPEEKRDINGIVKFGNIQRMECIWFWLGSGCKEENIEKITK